MSLPWQATRNLWIFCVLVLIAVTPAQAVESSLADLIKNAGSGDEAARVKALDTLGTHGASAASAVPELTRLLADKSPKVRAHAAHALGKIGSAAKPAAAALAALAKDEDAVVRRQAVKAIVAIHPGPEVMIPIVVKLLEDSDPGVQLRILDAAASAGPAAVPGLIQALKNPKSAYWACLVLREIGPDAKDAVPALSAALKSKQLEIPREAALALGAIGPVAASALPELAAALDDKQLREAATMAIGQIGSAPAGAVDKLRANAASDDRFLSTLSYWTLARVLPDDKALRTAATERLAERLTDKEPFIRAAAARALAALPPAPEITLPILEKTLHSADEATARNALGALATLGPAAVPRLIEALKYKPLREDIAIILGQMGPAAAPATEALSRLLEDENKHVAIESALALARIGPKAVSAVPALSTALGRKDCSNAHAIVFALGKIGTGAKAAEPQLRSLMQGSDLPLAAISAWATTQLQPDSAEAVAQAIPVIVSCMKDPLPESRQSAVESLGSLGPKAKAAIPVLEKIATQDPKESVRKAAAKALASVQKSIK